MERVKTKFGWIVYKKGDTSIKEVLKAVRKAEIKNYSLFRFKPSSFKVEFVYSNHEYDKKGRVSDVKTWRGGMIVDKNRLIMFSPSIKKPGFGIDSFFFHELNHIFYTTLIKSYSPVWFSEGMAMHLMKTYKLNLHKWKNYFRSVKNPERYLFYRYIKKKFYNNANMFYPLSFIVYSHLHKKYGWKRTMLLLRAFSKKPLKSEFNELFKKYFGLTVKKAVSEAIK